MSGDVTIPADVAKRMAEAWRRYSHGDVVETGAEVRAWADLLDPKPPTLREKVADALTREPHWTDPAYTVEERADAVLAVIADWLQAQPVQQFNLADPQRDHDVRLLRGGT